MQEKKSAIFCGFFFYLYCLFFCYSINDPNPTINDNNVEIQGTGLGEYSYYLRIPLSSSYGRYYVRSWLMYGTDNIVYGNVVNFYCDL